jgi:Predicted dehydrogenases and related proteins
MKKICIGVLCPSEIAFRRFMPAVLKNENIEYVGIAHANELEWFGSISNDNNIDILNKDLEKAKTFVDKYGGKIFNSYEDLIKSKEIDAIYIPLPPALHFKWAKLALMNGKHVFVEKPSTTSYRDTKELIELAKNKKLAFCENYMFVFHSQLNYVNDLIKSGKIGEIRLLRIMFGFPFRGINDFRYCKSLGGGALLDCGGYTIKLAALLLGDTAKLVYHHLNYIKGFDVDIYGSGVLKNNIGEVAQISFGMDNSYKCELDVVGSKGEVITNRIMTAPDGYNPILIIKTGDDEKKVVLDSDDSFKKSICFFCECIRDYNVNLKNFGNILKQAKIVDQFKKE